MNDIEDSHRALRLLEEISTGDELTQRDLSDRAGMALGLVNTYLKHLVNKGYIKISGIPPKRFKYYVTPKGFMEKSKLTYKLLQNYTRVFQEARKDYKNLFCRLKDAGVREVFFVGIDDVAEIAYLSLQEVDIKFLGAVDEDKKGGDFFRTTIMSFKEFEAIVPGRDVVITTYRGRDDASTLLKAVGVEDDRIHSIYPLQPAPSVTGRPNARRGA